MRPGSSTLQHDSNEEWCRACSASAAPMEHMNQCPADEESRRTSRWVNASTARNDEGLTSRRSFIIFLWSSSYSCMGAMTVPGGRVVRTLWVFWGEAGAAMMIYGEKGALTRGGVFNREALPFERLNQAR